MIATVTPLLRYVLTLRPIDFLLRPELTGTFALIAHMVGLLPSRIPLREISFAALRCRRAIRPSRSSRPSIWAVIGSSRCIPMVRFPIAAGRWAMRPGLSDLFRPDPGLLGLLLRLVVETD